MISLGERMISYRTIGALLLASGLSFSSVDNLCAQPETTSTADVKSTGSMPQRRNPGQATFSEAMKVKNLTSEQKDKLSELQTSYVEKAKEIRKQGGITQAGVRPDPEALKSLMGKMQELTSQTRTQIEEILTEEQRTEFEEKLKALGTRRPVPVPGSTVTTSPI